MQQFRCTTQIHTGPDALSALSHISTDRLLIVTDPYFNEDGTAQRLARQTGAHETSIFHEVAPDPSADLIARGTAQLKTFCPDTVIALGGGSAMDCAKAMVYFSGTAPQLIAIPTTSGSGSEVTDFAIITHDGVKHPLVDGKLRPAMAIVDPSLVERLPRSLIADGGFDVLTHALEAYVAKGADRFSDALAADAFRTTLSGLSASFSGDLTARGQIHTAATMAGLAFTGAGLGLCHAMAHSLGGALHLPHGRLNAILLPAVIAHTATPKHAQLARSAGLEGKADTLALRDLRNALIRLRRELGLPDTLAAAGVSPTAVRQRSDDLIRATLADPCCGSSPVPVTADMAAAILREVTGHG